MVDLDPMEAAKQANGKPLVARGPLVAWERERRARLAVLEEEAEFAQMDAIISRHKLEIEKREQVLKSEIAGLRRTLEIAQSTMRSLQRSTVYQLIRMAGRWDWLDQSIIRVRGHAVPSTKAPSTKARES